MTNSWSRLPGDWQDDEYLLELKGCLGRTRWLGPAPANKCFLETDGATSTSQSSGSQHDKRREWGT